MKVLILIGLFWFCDQSAAKYVEGHLKTSADWAFLARFCFLSYHGRYQYEIEYEKRYGEVKLLLYYDDKKQWPAVYKTDKELTCSEKISVLSVLDNQIVPLTLKNHPYSGCQLLTQNGKDSGSERRPPVPSGGGRTSPKDDPFTFDQFLKTTTTESTVPTEPFDFNMTESDFSTIETNTSEFSDERVLYSNVEFNSLENTTDYKIFVEELFHGNQESSNVTRVRRASKFDTKLVVSCSNHGTFTSSRQRWWYIAVSNCGSNKGLDIVYRFKMTNGETGDFWHEHFSADEMYIPPILLIEAIAYTLLLLAVFLCAVELKSRHLYHCTYRLFALSVLLQWFGILLLSVTWAKYAVSGFGPFPVFGGFFTSASEITFLLLLLLMAKGYTITRARLKTCATVKITVFTNLYVIVYISLYIYQSEAFDPGEVLNLYESPAGFGLAGLRCIGWGFFIYSCAATIRKFTEKGPFYYPFTLLGSVWIMSGPILTVVGVNVLDPWVRESVMHAALGAVAFCGHVAFLWITWPSRANKSFPYHVRTNHVGVSTVDDEVNYPRHTYEPAPPETGIIIPLSSNATTLNGIYDQYLRERDVYHSSSTPISYASFPANAKVYHNSNHNGLNHTHERIRAPLGPGDPITEDTHQSPLASAPHSLAISNHNNNNYGNDILVDSGHPSLDVSVSTSPPKHDGAELQPETAAPSAPPMAEELVLGINSPRLEPKPFNPFIVGASSASAEERRRLSNKVILPRLEGTHEGNVPKHLFAVKRDDITS
ncbi:transmembrane protein 145 [Culex quinquefasciatus]|uniref:transmembrane protein 145 n=1 Tax=Culex quinquefasciatus TaxID=7176 RepID=UPI0018E37BF3|nr:transmembrane protein 145 [Culex quinquefasciatus]